MGSLFTAPLGGHLPGRSPGAPMPHGAGDLAGDPPPRDGLVLYPYSHGGKIMLFRLSKNLWGSGGRSPRML